MIDDGESGLAGEVVAAAGEGRGDVDPHACQGLGDGLRGLVFVDVVGVEARGHDRRDAGRLELVDILGRQAPALGEVDSARTPAMRQDGAGRLVDRCLPESHAAATFGADNASRRRARTSMIWPRIDTAISAGDLAPMLRPTGPWMRENISSVMPTSASRSLRLAWVRRLPSAPM